MDIDKEILSKTTNCAKNFDCINSDKEFRCKVEDCVNSEVHFVKCINVNFCAYKMSFAHSFICTCPTRKEIYNKYGV